MSSPSWITRVLRESLSVHLDEHQETDSAGGPSASSRTINFRSVRDSQTIQQFSANSEQASGSPAAAVLPLCSAATVAAASGSASAVAPHTASLTAAAARATGIAPLAASRLSAGPAAPPCAAATFVPATLPPRVPPFVEKLISSLSRSPSGGLSLQTDASATNSSNHREAAVSVLIAPERPAAIIASSGAAPPLPHVRTTLRWQSCSNNASVLSPTACRQERGPGAQQEKISRTRQNSIDQKAPTEGLPAAASILALTTTMPAAPLAITSAPSTKAASPGKTEDAAGGAPPAAPRRTFHAAPPSTSSAVVGPSVALALNTPPASTAGIVGAPVPANEVESATAASRVKTIAPAAKKDSKTKTVENGNVLQPHARLCPRICPPATPSCLAATSPKHETGERSGTDSALRRSLHPPNDSVWLGGEGCITGSSLQKPSFHTAGVITEKKSSDYLDAAVHRGTLGQLAALCTNDASVSAATTDLLGSGYLDTFFAQLQPATSPPDAASAFPPHGFPLCPAFLTSAYAANTEIVHGDVSQLAPTCGASVGSISGAKTANHCTSSNSPATVNTGTSASSMKSANDGNGISLESASDCSSANTDSVNVRNECSDAGFLPSLLPLLSHINALSLSVTDTPCSASSFTCGDGATPSLSQTPSSSFNTHEPSTSNSSIDSCRTTAGTQTHQGAYKNSPSRTSPYCPFFSFNSISSAFQSPAVSHITKKSFCTVNTGHLPATVAPLSSAGHQSAAAVNAFGNAVGTFALRSEQDCAPRKTHAGAEDLLAAASCGCKKQGRTTPSTTAPRVDNADGTAAEPGIPSVTTALVTTKATATEDGKNQGAPPPTAVARMVSAGKKQGATSQRETLKPSAEIGAGGASAPVGGAAVAAAGAAASSAAKCADRTSEIPGTCATDPQQVVADNKSNTSFSSNSPGTSRQVGTSDSLGHCSSLQARKGSANDGYAKTQLPATEQLNPWSCFSFDTPHQPAEAGTAMSARGYKFAVDEVYCMQTPSRTRFSSVRVSPLLSQVYAASDNGVLCVWNMTGCCQRPLVISSYHSKAITELDVSPDGQLLASASLDGTIRVKYTATATHVSHPSCASTNDSTHPLRSSSLTSSRAHSAARLYSPAVPAAPPHPAASTVNAGASHLYNAYQLPGAPASTAAHTCAGLHGRKVAGNISPLPASPLCYAQPFSLDPSHARSVPPSNSLLLPSSTAGLKDFPAPPPTNLKRPVPGEQQPQQHTVRGHSNAVVSLHFSSDGALLLSASRDKSVKLWKTPSLDFLAAFTGHTNWVCCARFAPICAGTPVTFASCAEDRTVRVWNAERKTPVLFFRLSETFQSTTGATLCGTLGSGNASTGGDRAWAGSATTGAVAGSSKFGPCLKSCRFIFGGASVLAGGSSDGTVTLWDVRQEPKAPSQYYNASWLQSAPLYSTASRPGSSGGACSSFGSGFKSAGSSVTCEFDRKGAVKKAGISYLDTTADGNSLLALSTAGVAHLIDLRYNKPLFSVGHTKTSVVPSTTPLVARGKKTRPTHPQKQGSINWNTPLQGASQGKTAIPPLAAGGVTPLPPGAGPSTGPGSTAVSISAEGCGLNQGAADPEGGELLKQQQPRQKRTTAVITAATFGPVQKDYESLSQLQQHQVLTTADAEGRVVVWRWDMAAPQVLYQQEVKAPTAAGFPMHEEAGDPFSAICSPYLLDPFAPYLPSKTAKDSLQSFLSLEGETQATEADYLGGGPSGGYTAENYGLIDFAGAGI